jgi:DNA modification methylase
MNVIDQVVTDDYAIYNADTVEVAQNLDTDSVDFSVFSPPFASLYTYSNSDRDMGNVKSDDDFWQQYKYLIKEQFRVIKPGRNIAIHCMNLPTSKQNDGFIGIKDFRGDLIRAYQDAGFIYHSEVCIWKNPVTAMTRTKALGLLHKTVKKRLCHVSDGHP